MRFKKFIELRNPNFDLMNKSLFETLRDEAIHSKSKSGINKILLMSEEELEVNKFYERYQHLK